MSVGSPFRTPAEGKARRSGTWLGVCCIGISSGLSSCKGEGSSLPRAEASIQSSTGDAPVPELRLLSAVELEGPERLEPSGLLLVDETLITVSDKHDTTLFEIPLPQGLLAVGGPHPPAVDALARTRSLHLRAHTHFAPPDGAGRLDLEGLAHGPNHTVWAVSESRSRVLEIGQNGSSRWVTPSLYSAARAAGCLEEPNAYFEGLTELGDAGLLLAAERQPRGLVHVPRAATGDLETARVSAQQLAAGNILLPEGRHADLSGLTWTGTRALGLVRSAHRVVELVAAPSGFCEGESWSFKETETAPDWAYEDQRFGMAEGLAVSSHFIFVVLDNNGSPRSGGGNAKPLLFIFHRPADM